MREQAKRTVSSVKLVLEVAVTVSVVADSLVLDNSEVDSVKLVEVSLSEVVAVIELEVSVSEVCVVLADALLEVSDNEVLDSSAVVVPVTNV